MSAKEIAKVLHKADLVEMVVRKMEVIDRQAARIAELEAEYRRLWDAGIAYMNTPGELTGVANAESYTHLVKALMQSRFWNESTVANADAGASPDSA